MRNSQTNDNLQIFTLSLVVRLVELKIIIMNEETNILSISLHYYLQEEGVHEMDALVHNICERQVLNMIYYLSKQCGCDVKVDIDAKEEGGIIDKIKVIAESAIFIFLFEKGVEYMFNPDKNYLDNAKTRIEIAEMIKHSSFTEDEVEALVGEDDALKRFTSSYYNNLSKENTVDKVETILTNNDDANDSVTFTVHKNNFQDKVIKQNIRKNKTTIAAATLYVGSPILINGLPDRWKGIYNGENILFTINDNEFLDQVYNREVKFESGTSLTCDLEITEHIKSDKVAKRTFAVLYVRSWCDGSHFQTNTKRYIKEIEVGADND